VGAFMPELVLCATIVLMLFVRVFDFGRYIDTFVLAFLGSVAALLVAVPWEILGADASLTDPATVSRMEIFTGMLVYDKFTVFIRAILLVFLVLFTVFTKLSGIPDREDGPDIYSLVFGSTIGLCLMASSNHLLMIFMAVEMASVPSYVLSGMLKGRREASEAALKYAVYGAGAAGVMLYGISLVAGILGTVHIPTMTAQLAANAATFSGGEAMVLGLGGLMVMVGLAFKLSAFPFHFWCPDVFEGASAEVNAFLSVASKAAALALLVRVAIGFGVQVPEGVEPGERTAMLAQATISESEQGTLLAVAGANGVAGGEGHAHEPGGGHNHGAAADDHSHDGGRDSDGLSNVRGFAAKLIALLAILSCTFGNLAAYGQTNIKRLLAYSTIAHAGYMMMAVPPMLIAVDLGNAAMAESALASLAVYITIYMFMNLGAFAIIAFLRNAMRTEEIADYAGLIRRCPCTVVCFTLIMFSLIGMPPLAGFIGKFAIFASIAEVYGSSAGTDNPATFLLVMLVLGGINTALSLFYYLRVVKVMTIDPEPEGRESVGFNDMSIQGAFIWLITIPTALWLVSWEGLHRWALAAAEHLFS
ncbi:MAG: NADH-quinone oxidoreductase subunit N, partial [Pirellulaceae bacterium]